MMCITPSVSGELIASSTRHKSSCLAQVGTLVVYVVFTLSAALFPDLLSVECGIV